MYRYEDITTVHIEPTQLCNAACPQCDRNQNGGWDNPYLTGADLTLADYHKIFPASFIRQLKTIFMCGNLGDPCVSKDSLEAFRYFRGINPRVWLSMNTNGGARDEEYWTELAKVFGKIGAVIFSIDGLEDTNHLYRRSNKWKKVMENSQAFIDGGGKAEWEFLIFKHNEHQIDEARRLSKEMGFDKFIAKKALGFQNLDESGNPLPHPVYKKDGTLDYLLEAPVKDSNRNLGSLTKVGDTRIHTSIPISEREKWDQLFMDSILDFDPTTAHAQSDYERRVNNSTINCKVLGQPENLKDKHEIYVTAQGLVMPCCWIGTIYYVPSNWFEIVQIQQVIKKFGEDNISLYKNTLEEVYNSGYFNIFKDGWEKDNIRCGKLGYCATTCGENNQIDDIWTHEENERGT